MWESSIYVFANFSNPFIFIIFAENQIFGVFPTNFGFQLGGDETPRQPPILRWRPFGNSRKKKLRISLKEILKAYPSIISKLQRFDFFVHFNILSIILFKNFFSNVEIEAIAHHFGPFITPVSFHGDVLLGFWQL